MEQFRMDNTNGYTQDALDKMNTAFDALDFDRDDEQLVKHYAEKILKNYDDGNI